MCLLIWRSVHSFHEERRYILRAHVFYLHKVCVYLFRRRLSLSSMLRRIDAYVPEAYTCMCVFACRFTTVSLFMRRSGVFTFQALLWMSFDVFMLRRTWCIFSCSAFSHEVLEGVRGAQMSFLFGQPGFGFLRCSRVLLHK